MLDIEQYMKLTDLATKNMLHQTMAKLFILVKDVMERENKLSERIKMQMKSLL